MDITNGSQVASFTIICVRGDHGDCEEPTKVIGLSGLLKNSKAGITHCDPSKCFIARESVAMQQGGGKPQYISNKTMCASNEADSGVSS